MQASDSSADSDPTQGLADASADLMESLNNLIGSLEAPTAHAPAAAQHTLSDSAAHQQRSEAAAEAVAKLEDSVAAVTGDAQLTDDGQSQLARDFEQQQHPDIGLNYGMRICQ